MNSLLWLVMVLAMVIVGTGVCYCQRGDISAYDSDRGSISGITYAGDFGSWWLYVCIRI